jgi:hypothetical protein
MVFFKKRGLALALALAVFGGSHQIAYAGETNNYLPDILSQYQESGKSFVVVRLHKVSKLLENSLDEAIENRIKQLDPVLSVLAGAEVERTLRGNLNGVSAKDKIKPSSYKGFKTLKTKQVRKGVYDLDVEISYVMPFTQKVEVKDNTPSNEDIFFIQEQFYPKLKDMIDEAIIQRYVLYGDYQGNIEYDRKLLFTAFAVDDKKKRAIENFVKKSLKKYIAFDKNGNPYIKDKYAYLFVDSISIQSILHFPTEGFRRPTDKLIKVPSRGGWLDRALDLKDYDTKKVYAPIDTDHVFAVHLFGVVRDKEGRYRPYLFGISEKEKELAKHYPQIPYLGGTGKLKFDFGVPNYYPSVGAYTNAMMYPVADSGPDYTLIPKGKAVDWLGDGYVDVSTYKKAEVSIEVVKSPFLPVYFR